MKIGFVLFVFLLSLPFAVAQEGSTTSSYYSVTGNGGPYSILPGKTILIDFTLSNKGYVFPRNVTAYIDPCPVGWVCENKTFSFNRSGQNSAENLSLKIPSSAFPKRYTFYILLMSKNQVRRGDDRVLVDVLTEKDAAAISVAQYRVKQEGLAAETPPLVVQPAAEIKKEVPKVKLPVIAVPNVTQVAENKSDIKDNVQRLESSRHFVEYASTVLVIVLVFVGVGAYLSYRKK